MSGQESQTEALNKTTNTQDTNDSNLNTGNNVENIERNNQHMGDHAVPIPKTDTEEKIASFNQITIAGYDSSTGLDTYGCTFEETLRKCETPPTCIKFIDTKQVKGDILPKDLVNVASLETIDISDCGLREIPQVLLQMKQLRELKASNNQISSLPNEWDQLDLKSLDISQNAITEVQPSLKRLEHLESLIMKDCNLTEFPYLALELIHLKTLDLDNNLIGFISQTENKLYNLENLSLKNCLLMEIPKWLISNLNELDVRENLIREFPMGLCNRIRVLRMSYLSHFDIIPYDILVLHNLKKLDISHCGLRTFPSEILKLENLQSLNIMNNNIHDIPRELEKLDLIELYIGCNPFDQFPDFLDMLLNLEVIDLTNCFLETFPFDCKKLIHLKEINISNNHIKYIPDNICQLKLKTLVLAENFIKQLPPLFGQMQELEVLDLSSTRIRTIPSQIFSLPTLGKLLMKNNAIRDFPEDWGDCINTKYLDLSENPRITVSPSILQLQKLETLLLETCYISEFPKYLLGLPRLKDLHLKNNLIKSVPNNFEIINLQLLDLEGNLLQTLPEAFSSQSKLCHLNLSSCRFKEFPNIILKLRKLKYIDISDNYLSALPRDWRELNPSKLIVQKNLLRGIDKSLRELKDLVTLHIDNCLLSDVPLCLREMVALTRLYMKGNNITCFSPDALPTNLILLDLSSNPLPTLPQAVSKCTKLSKLLCNDCGIDEIPEFILRMKELRELQIADNHLLSLPDDWGDLNLTHLDVSDNVLCEVNPSIKTLSRLESLKMTNCNIKTFPYIVAELKLLLSLTLDNNPIANIEDSGYNLTNLQYLSLVSCRLQRIPVWLLSNVKELDASSNSIQSFPASLCKDITKIKLDKNQLDSIPETVCCLSNLQWLDVSNCGLKQFPDVLLLKNLRCLDVKDNFIRMFPEEIVQLESLKELYLGNNPIDVFPDFLDQMHNLEIIDLENCFLDTFPFDFHKLTMLRELHAKNNFINEIPESMCNLRLNKLLLNGNPIPQLPNQFKDLQELEELDLSSTKLVHIPDQILNLTHLQHLRMRNNAIETLPSDWGKCQSITFLDLSENTLTSLSSVTQLQKLIFLLLDSCSLTEFPNEVLNLHHLEFLTLENNLLLELPNEIDKLQFEWLYLGDNLLHTLPDTFDSQVKLKHLDLSSCRFFEFPSATLKVRNIKSLNMSNNIIQLLPNSWQGLSSVQELSLDNNPLTIFDHKLNELKCLVELKLINCLLTNIPADFAALERLSRLDVSNNKITANGLKQLPPDLIELVLENNPLEMVPSSMDKQVKLSALSLSNCGLDELPAFVSNLNRLQELHIGGNRLKSIPSEMQNLKLHTLNINWNLFETLNSLGQLKMLRNLEACGCQLESFPRVLMQLPKLTKVDLDWNAIGTFPDDLQHSNITCLHLNNASFPVLPQIFTNLTNLSKLELDSSKLLDFPGALLQIKSLKELTIGGKSGVFCKLPRMWNSLNLGTFKCLVSLNDMPTSLEQLRQLTGVYLRSSLDPIPDQLAQCKFLRHITSSSGIVGGKHRNVLPIVWKCQQLLSLRLSSYSLVDIPDSLAELTELEHLSFNSCHLLTYPNSLNQCLKKLKTLDIGDNEFTSLPETWCCKNISVLNLMRAPRELWSHSLSQLKNLKEVSISYCRLKFFPDTLMQLKKLENLNIENNQIVKLPNDWHGLQLRKLNLSDNTLSDETFASLEQLPKLDTLNISGNDIVIIPETILFLKYLNILNVSNNPDCKFPNDMENLDNLEEFSASTCKLDDFPRFLLKLKKLKYVGLNNNKIKRLPSHFASLSLQRISLTNNPLQISTDSLSGVSALRLLRLSSCQLTEIPSCLLNVSILETLDIQGNRIETISDQMYNILKRIPRVEISTSILKEPPREVYEAGHETIERYYKDLKLGRACKVGFHNVILLGSTTAGKTSLIKSLMSNESVLTEKEDRTIAIDEESWELTEDLNFHVIDFGGHDIYELVYPIFLKDREATVIIAVDLSTISDAYVDKNLFRWLNTVLSLSGTSSEIIVAGTKADLCKDQARNTHYLRKAIDEWIDKSLNHADEIMNSECVRDHTRNEIEHFKLMAVREIRTVATSSASMTGFDILKDMLLNQSRKKAVKLPEMWFDLYKTISEQKALPSTKGYLTTDQLVARFPRSVQGLSVSPCLKYLHQRGVVIWYQSDSELSDYIFYDTRLIINVLKEILSHNLEKVSGAKPCRTYFRTLTEQRQAVAKFRSTGIASEILLRYVWRDIANTDEIFNLVITFLKLFSLCYEAVNENSTVEKQSSPPAARGSASDTSRILYFPWFVRNSIEEKEFIKLWPEEVPSGMIPLKFVFIFAHKIPTSLFEQFSVRFQTLLVKGHRRQDWKNTIYVTQNGIQILIHKEKDQTKNRAYLAIQSRTELANVPRMVKLCVSVVQEMKFLMKLYPGILYEENYMCPHCIMTHAQDPTTLLLDEALEEYPGDIIRVCCENVDNITGEVPAALHYPKLLGTTESWEVNDKSAMRHHALVQSFLVEHEGNKAAAQMRHNQLADVNIVTVSKYIADDSELQEIGVNLGLPLHQIKSIRTNQQQDINLAACEVLQVWKQDRLEQGWTTQQMKEELGRVLIDMSKYDAEAELSESYSTSKSPRS